MREIINNVFVEETRLDIKQPPSINLIIIKGEDRSLLFDSGVSERYSMKCKETLTRMLDELNINFDKLDCFISHAHQDHVGLVKYLKSKGVRIMMNPEEKVHQTELVYYRVSKPQWRSELFKRIGLTEELFPEVYKTMWEYAEEVFSGLVDILDFDFIPVNVGDKLFYGGYDFEIISLKGHTFGQIGLWDKVKKVVFCADHIMKNIVPIVGCTQGDDAYLTDYLKAMGDVKHKYMGALFIPCHGLEFYDADKEANRIIYSYLDKASLMYELLKSNREKMTVRDVGVKVYGRNANSPNIAQFPSYLLIWSKTYACLEYMKEKGLLKESICSGTSYWELIS